MNYPFILVCHPATNRLYRHFRYYPIPPGFYKVVWYKTHPRHRYRYYPNDPETDELKPEYWSLPRTTDKLL